MSLLKTRDAILEPARPTPRPRILEISAYVPGSHSAETQKVYRLSANESPVGASSHAMDAYRQAAGRLEDYPDGSAWELRSAIADVEKIDAAQIICGNGSGELLSLLAQVYAGPEDEILFPEHGFLLYKIATLAAGATPVLAPERDYTTDVDAILAAVTDRTRLVFLANPNNPTGTYIPSAEIERIHAGLPGHVVLVLDAAYAEYVTEEDYVDGADLVGRAENVVMTRTFSKIHGLAALRVGWAYGPPAIIDALNRVRGPFNVNAGAIAAGSAGIRDTAHLDRARAHNTKWRGWLAERLEALGLTVTPSVGNFLLVHFPREAGRTAEEADAFLVARGVLARRVAAYGLPHALRVSIGDREGNEAFLAGVEAFLKRD